jgi:hypothetical protein
MMSAQIQAMMAEQAAQGDRLLTEKRYGAATPELKQEIVAYARSHRMKLGELVTQAFAALLRQRGDEFPAALTKPPAPVKAGAEAIGRAGGAGVA